MGHNRLLRHIVPRNDCLVDCFVAVLLAMTHSIETVYTHLVLLLRLFAEPVTGSLSSTRDDSTRCQKLAASVPVTTAFSWASLSATG